MVWIKDNNIITMLMFNRVHHAVKVSYGAQIGMQEWRFDDVEMMIQDVEGFLGPPPHPTHTLQAGTELAPPPHPGNHLHPTFLAVDRGYA